MSTLILAFTDPLLWQVLMPFLVYLAAAWCVYLIKLGRSALYRPFPRPVGFSYPSLSVIIPVYNEAPEVWERVLDGIGNACRELRHEIIIVPNGKNAEQNAVAAERRGYRVHRLTDASKRKAIALGAGLARNEISVILDSDTLVPEDALHKVLWPFADAGIGGVTPRHVIAQRQRFWRRISDWLEDNRFNELVRGQSVGRAVSCLPGRLFAMRTAPLKDAAPALAAQRFLGALCISGDDRFLTSWLLSHGYQAVYQSTSVVYTEAPDSFIGFLKQRLRWSRGSFRGTLVSLRWLWRFPYTAFTLLSTIALRWCLFGLLVYGITNGNLATLADRATALMPTMADATWLAALAGFALFLLGALPKRLRHLCTHPYDTWFYPFFLVAAIGILTPLEWYGNITCWKQGWLTRTKQHKAATGALQAG